MAERRESWDSWRRRSGLEALAGQVQATPEPSEALVKQLLQAAQRPPSELPIARELLAQATVCGPEDRRAQVELSSCVVQPPACRWPGLALLRSLLAELLWQHITRLLSPLLTSRSVRRSQGHPRRPP